MSSSRVYVPQGPCWILVFLLNTLHLSYSRRPCVLTLHLCYPTLPQCTQCKKSGTAQSILCIICLSLLEVKTEGVKKGYVHTRRDQSSGLSVSHLGSCCWEKNLLAAAVEGEAVHHDNKCGAQCSHFKFKKFQVAYIMLTSTVVCHSTHKGIDQDLP